MVSQLATQSELAALGYDTKGIAQGVRKWKHGSDSNAVSAYNADPETAEAPTLDSPIDWQHHILLRCPYNSEIVGQLTNLIKSKMDNNPDAVGGPFPAAKVRARLGKLLGTIRQKEAFLVKKEAAQASGNSKLAASLKGSIRSKKASDRRYSRRRTV